MEDRLKEDLKIAMKSGNTIQKNTIQQIRAALLLARKDNPNLNERDIENIIAKERSKRIEALVQFEKGNRPDLVEATNKELMYINSYLPQPMSESELNDTIKKIMIDENITDKKLMGFAIKKCKDVIGSRASGKQISDKVKEFLEGDIYEK